MCTENNEIYFYTHIKVASVDMAACQGNLLNLIIMCRKLIEIISNYKFTF